MATIFITTRASRSPNATWPSSIRSMARCPIPEDFREGKGHYADEEPSHGRLHPGGSGKAFPHPFLTVQEQREAYSHEAGQDPKEGIGGELRRGHEGVLGNVEDLGVAMDAP